MNIRQPGEGGRASSFPGVGHKIDGTRVPPDAANTGRSGAAQPSPAGDRVTHFTLELVRDKPAPASPGRTLGESGSPPGTPAQSAGTAAINRTSGGGETGGARGAESPAGQRSGSVPPRSRPDAGAAPGQRSGSAPPQSRSQPAPASRESGEGTEYTLNIEVGKADEAASAKPPGPFESEGRTVSGQAVPGQRGGDRPDDIPPDRPGTKQVWEDGQAVHVPRGELRDTKFVVQPNVDRFTIVDRDISVSVGVERSAKQPQTGAFQGTGRVLGSGEEVRPGAAPSKKPDSGPKDRPDSRIPIDYGQRITIRLTDEPAPASSSGAGSKPASSFQGEGRPLGGRDGDGSPADLSGGAALNRAGQEPNRPSSAGTDGARTSPDPAVAERAGGPVAPPKKSQAGASTSSSSSPASPRGGDGRGSGAGSPERPGGSSTMVERPVERNLPLAEEGKPVIKLDLDPRKETPAFAQPVNQRSSPAPSFTGEGRQLGGPSERGGGTPQADRDLIADAAGQRSGSSSRETSPPRTPREPAPRPGRTETGRTETGRTETGRTETPAKPAGQPVAAPKGGETAAPGAESAGSSRTPAQRAGDAAIKRAANAPRVSSGEAAAGAGGSRSGSESGSESSGRASSESATTRSSSEASSKQSKDDAAPEPRPGPGREGGQRPGGGQTVNRNTGSQTVVISPSGRDGAGDGGPTARLDSNPRQETPAFAKPVNKSTPGSAFTGQGRPLGGPSERSGSTPQADRDLIGDTAAARNEPAEPAGSSVPRIDKAPPLRPAAESRPEGGTTAPKAADSAPGGRSTTPASSASSSAAGDSRSGVDEAGTGPAEAASSGSSTAVPAGQQVTDPVDEAEPPGQVPGDPEAARDQWDALWAAYARAEEDHAAGVESSTTGAKLEDLRGRLEEVARGAEPEARPVPVEQEPPAPAVVIVGEVAPDGGTILLGGRRRDVGEAARWIGRNTDHEVGEPLVLVVPEHGPGVAPFAQNLADRVGGPVTVAGGPGTHGQATFQPRPPGVEPSPGGTARSGPPDYSSAATPQLAEFFQRQDELNAARWRRDVLLTELHDARATQDAYQDGDVDATVRELENRAFQAELDAAWAEFPAAIARDEARREGFRRHGFEIFAPERPSAVTRPPNAVASTANGAVVIRGTYDPATGAVTVDGRSYDLDAMTAFVEERPNRGPGAPVALIAPGAGTPGPSGEPSFADSLAIRLGANVMVADPVSGEAVVHVPPPDGSAPVVPEAGSSEAEGVGATAEPEVVATSSSAPLPEEGTSPPPKPGETSGTQPVTSVPVPVPVPEAEGAPPGPPVEPPPQPRRVPWYVDSQAMGEATVVGVDAWTAADVAARAGDIADGVRRDGDSPRLGEAIRRGVEAVLGNEAGGAEMDIKKWERLLQEGRTIAADGHLVYIRPVLANGTVAEQPQQRVRHYKVSFASMKSGVKTAGGVSRSFDGLVLAFFSVAASGAGSLASGAPSISLDATMTREDAVERQLIAGRKLFVADNARFRSGMDVLVFVDGVERTHNARLPQRFDVDFPKPLTEPGAPRPAETDARPAEPSRGRTVQRFSQASETLNAVSTVRVVADLQRNLLAGGLSASAAKDVVDDVVEHLTEKSARNRSRLLLSNGVPTTRVATRSGLTRFDGHFSISARVERLQYLGDTSMQIREDTGGGVISKPGVEGKSKAAVGYQATYYEPNALDLLPPERQPSVDGDRTMLRGGVTIPFSRGAGHGLSEQALGHAVLNRSGPQSRYRVGLRYTIDVRSRSHDIRPVDRTVEAEISVPRTEAAAFEENLTGAVQTPSLRPGAVDAPAGPGPTARVLPRPHVPVTTRRPGYPRIRGLGFGMASLLPGSEVVYDHIRTTLREMDASARRRGTPDWGQVDMDLATWFSRPALEADLTAVMGGVDHTVSIDGRDYRVTVTAYLTHRRGGDTYTMTVNGRAMMAEAASGHRGTEGGIDAVFGAGVRLGRFPFMRFTLGAWSAAGSYSYSKESEFGGTAKSYRRTETTAQVDEHNFDVVYEVSVRPRTGNARTFYVHRPGEITARIVVPEEHRTIGLRRFGEDSGAVPALPVTERVPGESGEPVERAVTDPETGLPVLDARSGQVDFQAGGTSGLYPAFPVMPRLARMAAQMYMQANGLDEGWLADTTRWPEAIGRAFRPDQLAAFFSSMAGGSGRTVNLPPTRDGRKQAFVIRLRAENPRRVAQGAVEIEQYAQGVRQHKQGSGHSFTAGHTFGAGPQFRFGSESDANPNADGTAPGGQGGDDHAPGGRVQIGVNSDVAYEWSRGKADVRENIDITRATYGGTTHTYRMDAAFEVTLYRWRGGTWNSTTRTWREAGGLDLLVPERRAFDLGLPVNRAAPPERSAPTRHVPPDLLAGMSYPENLDAGQVLPVIRDWLRQNGVLRAPLGRTERPNLLQREIEASFSSEALRNQHVMLLGSGVRRWLPVPQPFGGTRYVWINVSARPGAATHQAPRPEVKLTLRTQGQTDRQRSSGRDFRYGAGFDLVGRGVGAGSDGAHRHGGLEFKAEGKGAESRDQESSAQELSIIRAGTREGSVEYEHPLRFRIEMGISTEPPEVVNVPARAVREAVIGAGRLLTGNDVRAGDLWYGNRPFVAHRVVDADSGGPTGSVRLLVPRHAAMLDAPAEASGPRLGGTPLRDDRPPWEGRNPEAVGRLADNLHPWGVPFAGAVERWAGLTATPYRLPSDLAAPGAWRVPGLDFTTIAGQRYAHFTSPEMIRPYIGEMIRGRYTVPVGSDEVTVGVEITGAHRLLPSADPQYKGRTYVQRSGAETSKSGSSREWKVTVGPETGGDTDGPRTESGNGFSGGRDAGVDRDGELAMTNEDNREATRGYRHYRFDVDVVIRGPRTTLRIPVEGGLYGMIPLEAGPDGAPRLVGDLERAFPPLFGLRDYAVPAPARTGSPPPPPDDPTPVEPAQVEPAQAEPAQAEPVQVEPAAVEGARVEGVLVAGVPVVDEGRPRSAAGSAAGSESSDGTFVSARSGAGQTAALPDSSTSGSFVSAETSFSVSSGTGSFVSAESPAPQATGGGVTEEQAAELERAGLNLVPVPADGDGIAHALTGAAPHEIVAIGGGTRVASPEEVRSHLADALAADLAREPSGRRLWPMLDRPGTTDEQRRSTVDAIRNAAPGSDLDTVAAAAAVIGLRITVLHPDGRHAVFGPDAGRPVTLVRLPERAAHTGWWAATEPVTAAPPPPVVPPVGAVPEPAAGHPVANLDPDPFAGS